MAQKRGGDGGGCSPFFFSSLNPRELAIFVFPSVPFSLQSVWLRIGEGF
jgi:hypothetical protein